MPVIAKVLTHVYVLGIKWCEVRIGSICRYIRIPTSSSNRVDGTASAMATVYGPDCWCSHYPLNCSSVDNTSIVNKEFSPKLNSLLMCVMSPHWYDGRVEAIIKNKTANLKDSFNLDNSLFVLFVTVRTVA